MQPSRLFFSVLLFLSYTPVPEKKRNKTVLSVHKTVQTARFSFYSSPIAVYYIQSQKGGCPMRRLRTLKSKLLLLFILSILCCSLSALISLGIQLEQSNQLLYQSTSEALNYNADRFHTTLDSIEGLVNLLLSDDAFLSHLKSWGSSSSSPARLPLQLLQHQSLYLLHMPAAGRGDAAILPLLPDRLDDQRLFPGRTGFSRL